LRKFNLKFGRECFGRFQSRDVVGLLQILLSYNFAIIYQSEEIRRHRRHHQCCASGPKRSRQSLLLGWRSLTNRVGLLQFPARTFLQLTRPR